jgi:hypothetical protein
MPAASLVRLALIVAVASLTAGTASAALERADAVGLLVPARIVQGEQVTMTATVRAGARCTLALRYRTGTQRVGSVVSSGGMAVFRFTVARRAAPGRAKATVSCGGAGRATRTFMVIGGVIAPKINVLKYGFSIIVERSGLMSTASWGVVLQNTSRTRDATRVVVLANFVMPDNKLIGTGAQTISRIRAGQTHVTGADLSFFGIPPVARLEVVVRVEGNESPQTRQPAFANAHPVPDFWEPHRVGSVEGEILNDAPRRTLRFAELHVVALDGAGNVIGGGSGHAGNALPPGARQFFKINGLRGVTAANVSSLLTSVAPTYD